MDKQIGEAEIEIILDEMRRGASAMIGCSRCHTVYLYRDGAFIAEEFDEGSAGEHPTSEQTIRNLIEGEPGAFVELLRQPHWRRLSAAFLRGEREEARRHLRAVREWGDTYRDEAVLDAALGWPGEKPAPEVAEQIRSELRGFTAYHVFMFAVGWEKTEENGRRGAAFVEQLIEMVGDVVGCYEVRAAFREMAGDLRGALADLEHELERRYPGGRGPKDLSYRTRVDKVRQLRAARQRGGSS